MSYQKNIVSFLGPAELDQLLFYLENASADQLNKDIYLGEYKYPGLITRNITNNAVSWLSKLEDLYKARLCMSAKMFYLKNKK